MITRTFEEIVLNSVLRGDVSKLPDNYYLGLCNNHEVTRDMTLADISEVVGEGYGRLACPRTAIGWQAVAEETDCLSIRSQQVTFYPQGTWTPFQRMFLCDVSSGSDGHLLAVSSPLPLEVELTAEQTYPVAFELYLK